MKRYCRGICVCTSITEWSQNIEGVIHEEVLSWYRRLYFNLQIGLKISRG